MAHKPCYHVTCDFPPSKSKNLKPKKAAQLHFTQIHVMIDIEAALGEISDNRSEG